MTCPSLRTSVGLHPPRSRSDERRESSSFCPLRRTLRGSGNSCGVRRTSGRRSAARGPLSVSYERQTFNWEDKPQSQEQLETRTRAGIDSGEYPRAEAWWAELLDPRNHDTATDEDEACALADGGTGADPGLERGSGDTGEEFLRRYDQVPAAVYPTTGLPSINGTVHLRWGYTTPNLDNSHIEWRGWGYRKITAKHGWGPEDLEATRVALLDGSPEPTPAIPGRYVYRGPEYGGRNGARCKRVVAVDQERNQAEIQKGVPEPAGIITSFGLRVG